MEDYEQIQCNNIEQQIIHGNNYEWPEEKFNYIMDVLGDEFTELDMQGNFVIKEVSVS